MAKFVIEHLDSELFEWSLIEYKHISKIVGKSNIIFCNIKNKDNKKILEKIGTIKEKSITESGFDNICILDLESKKELTTEDARTEFGANKVGKFDYFVFGGILGDDPPQQRTQELLKKIKGARTNARTKFGTHEVGSGANEVGKNIIFETRNLGKKQMSTDTAVLVVKKILDGSKLSEIEFKDGIEIEIREGESVLLPYRYVIENGEPVYSDELVFYLKNKEEF